MQMKYKLTGFIACTATLLVACSKTETAPVSDMSIDSVADELYRQHLNNLTLTEDVSLTEAYGDKWEKFAVFCSAQNPESVKYLYHIAPVPFKDSPDMAEGEAYLYLSDHAGTIEWIRLNGENRINFCPFGGLTWDEIYRANAPLTFRLTDDGTWKYITSTTQKPMVWTPTTITNSPSPTRPTLPQSSPSPSPGSTVTSGEN